MLTWTELLKCPVFLIGFTLLMLTDKMELRHTNFLCLFLVPVTCHWIITGMFIRHANYICRYCVDLSLSFILDLRVLQSARLNKARVLFITLALFNSTVYLRLIACTAPFVRLCIYPCDSVVVGSTSPKELCFVTLSSKIGFVHIMLLTLCSCHCCFNVRLQNGCEVY